MQDRDFEALRMIYAGFSSADPERVLAQCNPDIEWHEVSEFPGVPAEGSWKGLERVAGYFAEFFDAWDEFRIEPTEFEESRDTYS